MKQFNEKIESARNDIKTRIFDLLEVESGTLLYEPVYYALDTGGKNLRPVLLYLAFNLLKKTDQSTLDAAAAVEFLHNFTLVHDDIMDRDELRRGKETVYKRWDENIAILAGDAMLVKCYQALAAIPSSLLTELLSDFSSAILEICEGQMMDIAFEARNDVILDEYFKMIDKKTARLFALSCEAGVYLAGASREQKAAMHQYGMAVGRAFQIQDDLLDVAADESVLGKKVGSDLLNEKKTFLVLHMQNYMTAQQQQAMSNALAGLESDPGQIRQVYELLVEIGTINAAQNEIQSALDSASKALDIFSDNWARQSLNELISIIKHRTF